MNSGALRSTQEMTIVIFPRSWEATFAAEYDAARREKKSPIPTSSPIHIKLKKGQEFSVAVGDRRPLLTDIIRIVPDEGMTDDEKDSPRSICAVDVTVNVGQKSYDGIVMSYDHKPVFLYDERHVKLVKKRA